MGRTGTLDEVAAALQVNNRKHWRNQSVSFQGVREFLDQRRTRMVFP